MDAFDAGAVGSGNLELELQPLGYFVVDAGDPEHYLVTPSVLAYLGITDRLDLIVLGRGYARVAGPAVMPRYHTRESAIDLRWLIVPGTYNEEGDGPSFALQAGVLLPNLGWDPGETIGAHAGAIFTWQLPALTIYANLWGARTPWESWDVFSVAAVEASSEWSVRPVIELWFDHDTHPDRGGDLPSVLAGVNVDLGESATICSGVRYAEWDGYREIEVRASLWWAVGTLWGDQSESEEASRSPRSVASGFGARR